MSKKVEGGAVLFSGIQPTGNLNIANYIGAIKHWVNLQTQYDCLFALVDLHAITVRQDPDVLRNHCYDLLSLYIACGIDPEKNTLFAQSHVSAHSELAWVLTCFTQMGELNRMTQFKDKSQKHPKNINAGLYAYPVLMAADILSYSTQLVPVGGDQKQHLELARNIAQRFNNIYGDVFVVPEPYIPPVGARIMGLQAPNKKMSKSDTHESNYIALLDPPDKVRKKIKRAVTDSGSDIVYDANRPGISNLLTLYSSIADVPIKDLEARYVGKGYGVFKADVAEAVVEFLAPMQAKFHEIRDDKIYLHGILKRGAEDARIRAQPILKRVHEVMGFIAAE